MSGLGPLGLEAVAAVPCLRVFAGDDGDPWHEGGITADCPAASDDGLAEVVDAWPRLADGTRTDVLRIVRSDQGARDAA